MANFNIDELTLLSKNDSSKPNSYTLDVICNARANPTSISPDVKINTDKIILDPKTALETDRISFTQECDFTDFADGKPKEKLDLETIIVDNNSGTPIERKKGGVVVIDTIYPPPNGAKFLDTAFHARFSSYFKLVQIKCQCDITTKIDTFDISIQMKTDRDYTSVTSDIIVDTINNDQRILMCNVTGNGAIISSPKTLNFDFKVNFDLFGKGIPDYKNGMPIIIKLVDEKFSNLIDVKKGSIVIKNTELLLFI